MSQQKAEHIAFLEQLTDGDLPELFARLDDQDNAQIHQFIETILERERAGLDRLFDSMSQTMKYIPNFILHAITPRYVSPPIAARIAARLAFKQALSIASGVSPDYLSETALSLDHAFAARILEGLPSPKARAAMAYLIRKNSLKALDILIHVDEASWAQVLPSELTLNIEAVGLSEKRLSSLRRLNAFYA